MTSIKLGVHLPVAGQGASPEAIAQVAEEAERLELDSVWSWERLMRPTVPIAMGGPGGPVMDAPDDFGCVYDPIETLSYVAARTSRITLGTSVLDALFQSPVILARRLATLDQLSAGRLVVGIGQGWMEQEFEAAGVSMKRRGAGFEEHLLAMRAVWGPDPVQLPRPLPPHTRGRHRPEAGPSGRPAPRDRGGIPAGDRARRATGYRVDPGDLRLADGPRRHLDLPGGGRLCRVRCRVAPGHASGQRRASPPSRWTSVDRCSVRRSRWLTTSTRPRSWASSRSTGTPAPTRFDSFPCWHSCAVAD